VAVAALILTAIYHMLKDGTTYQDLGPNHFQQRDRDARKGASFSALPPRISVELVPLTASASP